MGKHTSHKDIVNRLKRAKGHLEKVINMIEMEEPCLKVSQQMHAVTKAIYNAKQTFIKDHIDHCLDVEILGDSKKLEESIKDFKEITKYLD
ncbi:MAG: metal-sensing transcriptional repressor [Lentisphaerales bacterium]|nr:metal-sensing transcriptional repressor [Lentisphaerales bacterium]